jgi:hypothetical protein
MNHQVEAAHGIVTLISPLDPSFQARVIRRIELGFGEPVMRVATTFERAADSARSEALSVWVITQLEDPVRCYIPVPNEFLPVVSQNRIGSRCGSPETPAGVVSSSANG